MSASNISEKQILSYLVSTFQYWGIQNITQQLLKQAKKNTPSCITQMKRLLLNLAILHMFSYQIKVNKYLPQRIPQTQIDEIIMSYLSETECPLLLEMKNEKKNQESQQMEIECFVGCNLESSRMLLLICGWVMAVSDYFNQILPNALESLLREIQKPQGSRNTESLIENKLNSLQKLGGVPESITALYKSIKSRLYSGQCYSEKLQRLRQRISTKLQKLSNTPISIDSLFASTSSIRQQKLQQRFTQIINNEIENMGQRKYFWIWLEEKIIKQTQTQIKNQHPTYSLYHQEESLIQYNTLVDLDYLSKYIELCQYYQLKYHQLAQKFNSFNFNPKKYKQIETQIHHQLKSILSNSSQNLNQNHKKHLFIALQLKSHLNISLQKNQPTKQTPKQQNQNHIKTIQLNKKLKKLLKNYLKSINQAITFI